jgi:hypothetical protein
MYDELTSAEEDGFSCCCMVAIKTSIGHPFDTFCTRLSVQLVFLSHPQIYRQQATTTTATTTSK